MRIEVKQEFLHERDRFLAGEIRVVSDELGAYFIKHGWASEFGKEAAKPSVEEVTLDIHNGKVGVADNHG